MDKQTAIDILIALACCSISELYCSECPLIIRDEERHRCRPWTNEEVREAVYVLKEHKKERGSE